MLLQSGYLYDFRFITDKDEPDTKKKKKDFMNVDFIKDFSCKRLERK